MAFHKCGCGCGESVYIPEEFGVELVSLQEKYEKDFITTYSVFKVGHLDKLISNMKKIANQDEN